MCNRMVRTVYILYTHMQRAMILIYYKKDLVCSFGPIVRTFREQSSARAKIRGMQRIEILVIKEMVRVRHNCTCINAR